MSTAIHGDRRRVWRALTDPDELVAWDERRQAPIDPPNGYPREGARARWRYRLGPVQLVLHDHPHRVEPPRELRSRISLASLRFEQAFRLAEDDDSPGRTRVGMKLVAGNAVPLLGEVIDRFGVRQLAASHVDATLRALTRWCERNR